MAITQRQFELITLAIQQLPTLKNRGFTLGPSGLMFGPAKLQSGFTAGPAEPFRAGLQRYRLSPSERVHSGTN